MIEKPGYRIFLVNGVDYTNIQVPPIPVLIKRGFCSADFWINILLCILGVIPGILHCYYIIAKYPYAEHCIHLESGERVQGGQYGSTV